MSVESVVNVADHLNKIDVCMCVCTACVFLYVWLCVCMWLLSSCTLFYHQLNIDKSLELQGPFDLILHKCTLLMVDAEDGDEQSLDAINNIKVIIVRCHQQYQGNQQLITVQYYTWRSNTRYKQNYISIQQQNLTACIQDIIC